MENTLKTVKELYMYIKEKAEFQEIISFAETYDIENINNNSCMSMMELCFTLLHLI